MRILFRLHRATIGGSQRSFQQLATLLARNGHEVEFCGDEGEWAREGLFAGFPYHTVRYCPFRLPAAGSALRMWRLLRKGRYDLLQTNGAYLGMESALPAALAGVPLVVMLPGGSQPLTPLAPRHQIVCFSRELEDALKRRYPGRPGGIWMVGNRIDCELIREKGEAAPPESVALPEGPGSRFLLSMTTRMELGKEKAVDHCLEAAALLRRSRSDFRFLLIGGGPRLERFREKAARRNEEAGDDYIRFLGPLENPFPVVRRADVVLGVGLSALEGGVFGKPAVIVGKKGYAGTLTPETVDRLEYYNFSGRNLDLPVPAEALARELQRLLDDGELRTRLGAACRDHVTRNLALDGVLERYEEAYRAAIRDRAGSVRETGRAVIYLTGILRFLAGRGRKTDAAAVER